MIIEGATRGGKLPAPLQQQGTLQILQKPMNSQTQPALHKSYAGRKTKRTVHQIQTIWLEGKACLLSFSIFIFVYRKQLFFSILSITVGKEDLVLPLHLPRVNYIRVGCLWSHFQQPTNEQNHYQLLMLQGHCFYRRRLN